MNEEVDTTFGPVNDTADFMRNGKQIATPQQIHLSIDQLFYDADVLSARFQDLIRCWMNGSPNISDFCDHENADLFRLNANRCSHGLPNIGPIKQITRSIAKIHRSYSGDFRYLTDLVSRNLL